MKLKKLTIALMALSFSAAAVAQDPEPTNATNPKLTTAEEAAFVLAESLLSITASLTAAYGCDAISGDAYKLSAGVTGLGSALYPKDGAMNNAIQLFVKKIGHIDTFGDKYAVYQDDDTPGFLGNQSIQNYNGILTYSAGGAILISDSYFEMEEFWVYFPWDEHNIKDFWQYDKHAGHIKDYGLEVITKADYPIQKWRQSSDHKRWNYYPDGEGGLIPGPGSFVAHKWLMTSSNFSECHIEMTGTVDQIGAGFSMSGNITVSRF